MAKSRYNEIYYRKIKKAPNRNVYMEMFFEHLEGGLKNYGVNTCCLLFPLRKGLLIIGYFSVFVQMLLIIGAATEAISPLFTKIQEGLGDEPSTAMAVAIPTTELAFVVVLLCATHRNDVGLLRFYMVYGCVAIGLTMVSYAIVVVRLSMLFIFALTASVSYQAYILLLVRSLVVKIRQAKCEVRMMSLKDLLNRKEIDLEASAPIRQTVTVPKDAGPGPLAAIVGNPKVEIVVKSEHTNVNDDETVSEIRRDTDEIVEKGKKSCVEIRNNEEDDKLNKKKVSTEERTVDGGPQEKGSKSVINAKLSFLGSKHSKTNKDQLNKGTEIELKEESKDKGDTKPNKTIFGTKQVNNNKITQKTVDREKEEIQKTTEAREKPKDKKEGKLKKTLFGVKKKDINKAEDISASNEPSQTFLEAVDQKSAAPNSHKQNDEKTEVVIETKIITHDIENMNKTNTVEKRIQKETNPIKEKRKIHKQTKGTDEMEEIELDVDKETERKKSKKLESIEEEPRRKWFWNK